MSEDTSNWTCEGVARLWSISSVDEETAERCPYAAANSAVMLARIKGASAVRVSDWTLQLQAAELNDDRAAALAVFHAAYNFDSVDQLHDIVTENKEKASAVADDAVDAVKNAGKKAADLLPSSTTLWIVLGAVVVIAIAVAVTSVNVRRAVA